MTGAQALDRTSARRIASAYLPTNWYGNRWYYHYARSKLARDPLYPGVVDALRGSDAPLLDLGCGIGLLALALRAAGLELAYHGVDNDAAKIAQARGAAGNAALASVDFTVHDLAVGLPAHRGSVAILDVLQFVPLQAQDAILDAAIALLTPGARLVIRTGLDDGSPRARTTRSVDALSRALRWMNAGPKRYPDADALQARFAAAGLLVDITPLYGNTPFNNWRVVATLPKATSLL
ncbi:MAG: class I SAM-dependent methyltransferase [Luteimonas sp.]